MQPNLGMNSSSPPPSLKCHTSLSFSLLYAAFSPPIFSHNPSISQSALQTLHFYFPSHLSFCSTLPTSHCSCESEPAHNTTVIRVNILILDHSRSVQRHSLVLSFSPSLPLSLITLIFSTKEKLEAT